MAHRKLLLTMLAVCMGIAFLAAAYPMYVIRPFRAQGPNELAAALMMRRWGPLAATICAAAAVTAAAMLLRTSQRKLSRLLTLGAAAATVPFAVFSHVNIFERMFHRIESPESIPAGEAKLESGDMVLAIHAGGQARAYPVRMMAYHHLVNDWLGGVPIVATY